MLIDETLPAEAFQGKSLVKNATSA